MTFASNAVVATETTATTATATDTALAARYASAAPFSLCVDGSGAPCLATCHDALGALHHS